MIGGARRRWARKRLSAAGADPRLLEYLGRSFSPPRGRPVTEVRFVVLDCETTGLDHGRDRLLTLAAVGVQGGCVDLADRLEVTFEGADVGGHEVAPIHGLVTGDLLEGLPEQDGLLDLLAFLKDDVLVAHHAAFDVAVLSQALARLGAPALQNPVLDTGHLVRRFERAPLEAHAREREDRSLDSLAGRLGLEIQERHSAAGDAFVTACALLVLLRRARRRGVTTLGELLAR